MIELAVLLSWADSMELASHFQLVISQEQDPQECGNRGLYRRQRDQSLKYSLQV